MGAQISEVEGDKWGGGCRQAGQPGRGGNLLPEGTWQTAHHATPTVAGPNLALLHLPRMAGLLASQSGGSRWLRADSLFLQACQEAPVIVHLRQWLLSPSSRWSKSLTLFHATHIPDGRASTPPGPHRYLQ